MTKQTELEQKHITALKAQTEQIKATKIIELEEEMASVSSDVEIPLREEEDIDWKKKERKKKKEEAEKKKKETIKVKRKCDEPIIRTLSAKSGQGMIKGPSLKQLKSPRRSILLEHQHLHQVRKRR